MQSTTGLNSAQSHQNPGVPRVEKSSQPQGRLTTLGRFIAKSVGKSTSLYQKLKGCIDKKQFNWTDKADAALKLLKDALQQLPTLACPLPGETLQMYLAPSKEAISSMLAVERGGKQVPIHFLAAP
uniref:Reverse transcriptase/retrotransposon-derived protein RNase H-like domain-containing protein n=1 Tax=Lactuca sativa TaxID=4236 RepID=A0A9R1VXX4_LACSA|nr:hypothetical protein LSAT_V11C400160510 [Lactuca sativa]